MLVAPSLWTPRAGPWWRLPAWRDLGTMFNGHLRRNPSNGRLYRNSSNHHLARCSCPCDGFASYTVVISGVTLCTCTGVNTATTSSSGKGERDINGSYTLDQVPDCVISTGTEWLYTENDATPFATAYTGSPACTNAVPRTGLYIRLFCAGVLAGGPFWSLRVEDYTNSLVAFSKIEAFVTCDEVTFTSTGVCSASRFFTGGSAVATGDA
jgi:hypothetical protein